MLFLPLYIVIAPSIGFSLEYEGLDPRLFTDSVFWFTILLVPAICSCRDFVWETVSPDPSSSISKDLRSTSPTVIDEHICLHHITLRRRYKSTTSPIIGHGRRST